MMGVQPPRQEKLFYTAVSLEQRVRPDHPLRRIAQTLDFDFIYAEVADRYGVNGHVSVPPPVTLKLMLLLVLYNVRSERVRRRRRGQVYEIDFMAVVLPRCSLTGGRDGATAAGVVSGGAVSRDRPGKRTQADLSH
jgi:hypothetical protein